MFVLLLIIIHSANFVQVITG